ncbi:MAG: bifunctional demethylmenaquinone methyltransferase/2-methoxy-6-polyprenyl-1,4-benzoquinol methylase UbiE [Bernardetiaceae bacterium]|nr:bifunctional demethylmenaquinone methyltransferase/2-methoxy-6-polyprenyl-1,4-benzoquinol methylase UbiE [Bernardetiaceae bacterium]
MSVTPYKDQKSSKKEQVATMFNNISGKYDFLNRLLSLGIDVGWRKKAVRLLQDQKPKTILDIATGTADFAIEARKLNPEKIIGVDISTGMLDVGRQKIKKKGYDDLITLQEGDSEDLPFEDNSFDVVIVAFGVRNFENLEKGLADMYRVMKPGGMLSIIEFSQPQSFPFKQIYNAYFKFVLPFIGKIISKDRSAYTYLPESVEAFPYGNDFLQILTKIGYKSPQCKPLTFGISSIYMAKK